MNKRCLIIRYGELFLKGRNKPNFIRKLVNNINVAFQKNNFTNFQIKNFSDQLVITAKKGEDLTNFFPILKNIFGISVFYLAYQLENSLEELVEFVKNFSDYYEIKFATFKLAISRGDKSFPKDSLTLQKELGGIITQKYQLKVNLSNPQRTFYIRIYQKFILVFSERIEGLGGLPVGSSGRVLVLLSGGIDSPVAAYQLMKRGLETTYLHFYQQKERQDKIFALCERLKVYNNYSDNVHMIDFQPLLNEIRHISQEKYRLIILKRMFIRYACLLARELKIESIATGDALAQVASQTLKSLAVMQQVSSLVILWPLISWNKDEIIKTAQRIKTYDLSLESYSDCCALFEPRHPVTKPRKEIVEKLEKEIFWLEVLEKIYNQKETDKENSLK